MGQRGKLECYALFNRKSVKMFKKTDEYVSCRRRWVGRNFGLIFRRFRRRKVTKLNAAVIALCSLQCRFPFDGLTIPFAFVSSHFAVSHFAVFPLPRGRVRVRVRVRG